MKNINRTYTTLRISRGKNRNAELVKLAEAKRDFEYRRLLIEEREADLHVFFSRKKVSEIISWILIIFALILYQFPVFSISLFSTSILFQFLKIYWGKRLANRIKMYLFSLKIVDIVIFEDYGILLSNQ
jgi:hypothetical protein